MMTATERDTRIQVTAQAKVTAAAQPKRERAQAAGARSTRATPMARQERIDAYQDQTGGGLTDRQWRRLNKKTRRNGYRPTAS